MREGVLEDYVVPICRAEIKDQTAHLRRLFGTAFFINDDGVFLTARHVFDAVEEEANDGQIYGLNVKSEDQSPKNLFTPIKEWEPAPAPFDIAIGKVDFKSRSWFKVGHVESLGHWKEVVTMGYPESALNISVDKFNIHIRTLKGVIQRIINADELPTRAPHPESFELSFVVTNGISGAPLFTADRGTPILVGICVGNCESEILVHKFSTVEENGSEFNERVSRVEQMGIAEIIHSLFSWSPSILGGVPLGEAITNHG